MYTGPAYAAKLSGGGPACEGTKDLVRVIESSLRHFFRHAKDNPLAYVEALFWRTKVRFQPCTFLAGFCPFFLLSNRSHLCMMCISRARSLQCHECTRNLSSVVIDRYVFSFGLSL